MEVKITLIDLNKYDKQYADDVYQQEYAVYKIEVCLSFNFILIVNFIFFFFNSDLTQCSLLWSESLNENVGGILQINKADFISLQPFHFIADRNCNLIQCGNGFYRHISMELLAPGTPLECIFDIIWPQISFNFDNICNLISAIFILQFKTVIHNENFSNIR
ncbi:unnamed protein product [Brugia timori]|uniref:guanylate cyclase n=1 Tax=Brugia timori TaxID=42155 RepID=A0A0R3QFU2_9BILA|nr:unnamed protein product [Brugia timori]